MSLIRDAIRLPEGLRYYQVRHPKRICLLQIYLHPLTNYSVSSRSFHTSSTPSQSCWYMNINMLSIGFACRLHLRTRLTLGGIAFPRNPWTSGGGVSRPVYRYSFQQQLLCNLQRCSRSTFVGKHNALLPLYANA